MDELTTLIREYGEVLDSERRLERKKTELRARILSLLESRRLFNYASPFGRATRTNRFKLTPRKEAVLATLPAEDLYPFVHFTPARVKNLLVPKYGRERLLPLFDIEKSALLMIKRPSDSGARPNNDDAG